MDVRSSERHGDERLKGWRGRKVIAPRLERAPFPSHEFPLPVIQMNQSRTIGQGRRMGAAVARSVARPLGGKPAFPTQETS